MYGIGNPFENIAIDIAGPFPKSESGNAYIIVIIDYFTKLVEIYLMQDMNAMTVAECFVVLRGWIKRYVVL